MASSSSVWPGAFGAAGSLLNGIIGSNASQQAGSIIYNAAQQAVGNEATTVAGGQQGVGKAATDASGYVNTAAGGANQNLYNVLQTQGGNLSPYLNTGTTATNAYNQAMQPGGALATTFNAPTAAQVQATPGYQFQLTQGQGAINKLAAAQGTLQSGGTLKSLDQYSQGLASTYYQNAFNNALQGYQTNYSNTLNSLNTGMNAGLNASNLYGQGLMNYGNQSSTNTMNAGLFQGNTTNNAAMFGANLGMTGAANENQYIMEGAGGLAAGMIGSSNAWQNAINGITSGAGNALNNNGNNGNNNNNNNNGGNNTGGSSTPNPYDPGGTYNPGPTVYGTPPDGTPVPPTIGSNPYPSDPIPPPDPGSNPIGDNTGGGGDTPDPYSPDMARRVAAQRQQQQYQNLYGNPGARS